MWGITSPISPPNPLLQFIGRLTGVTKDNWLQALGIITFWLFWVLGGFILAIWAVFYYTKDWSSGVAIDWIPKWLKPFWEI